MNRRNFFKSLGSGAVVAAATPAVLAKAAVQTFDDQGVLAFNSSGADTDVQIKGNTDENLFHYGSPEIADRVYFDFTTDSKYKDYDCRVIKNSGWLKIDVQDCGSHIPDGVYYRPMYSLK